MANERPKPGSYLDNSSGKDTSDVLSRWGHVGINRFKVDFFNPIFIDRLVDRVEIENTPEYEAHAGDSTRDEDPAKTALRDCIMISCPIAPPDAAELCNLGNFYRERFLQKGELDDINQAIAFTSRALTWIPDGNLALPVVLNNLGRCFCLRFNRLGELDDLSKSMEYLTRAVSLTQDRHPNLPIRLNNLGLACFARFVRLGQLDDIEQAIMHQSRALTLTPVGHSTRSLILGNLGQLYYHRFDHLGELDDLNMAIEYVTRGMDSTQSEPISLLVLGMSYRARYHRLKGLDEINRAIDHITRALGATPANHPNMPIILSGLGGALSDRFYHHYSPDDLTKSIEHITRAVHLTPEGHAEFSVRLENLGLLYLEYYEFSEAIGKFLERKTTVNMSPVPSPHGAQGPDALKKSSEYISRAIGLSPDEHPGLASMYRHLAKSSLLQYRRTNDLAHLQDFLDYSQKGSQLAAASPRDRFQCALDWATGAFRHDRPECMKAYQTAIDLLPRVIWLGATIRQRYEDLTKAGNLAMGAAHAAILYSDRVSALEWLEHARCVVWTQRLTLRTPLDQLRSSHPELAIRLQAVSEQLQVAGNDLPKLQALSGDTIIQEQTGQDRSRLALEYDSLLAKARSLPGLKDFLKPIKAKDLMRAARYGPVVVINCHEQHCDALAILPGQGEIKHRRLPDYNQEKARDAYLKLNRSLQHKDVRQRGARFKGGAENWFPRILPELWTCVVKPVLDLLELTNDIPTNSLPHITWCPTGAMTFLPLHAAGDYDKPRSCVFDYAISSYTPTLTALLTSTPSKLPRTPRVLAIGQANTPNKKPLHATASELRGLEVHAQGKFEYSQLTDSQATVVAVLDAMEAHEWVHLACHAHQNNDPTKSGFFLYDGTLDITSINRRSFSNKGLAFLSACQTATGDEKLPDEAIHLASGMLMAGYPSVIASMWSVMDEDGPFVADRVYAKLMNDGRVGNGEAGRALHEAVGLLREKVGVKKFRRWVPYIHIGS